MEIICSTTYDRRALSALARALRKTVRRTRSRLLRVWCWVLLVLSLLSAWVSWGEWGTVALNGAVAVLMLAVLLGEDAINAFFARRWAMPRLEDCDTCFYSDYYETRFPGSVTQWQYDRILHLAETSRYIILILGKNHAQACGKADLAGGSVEAFRSFLEQKTGKETQYIGG